MLGNNFCCPDQVQRLTNISSVYFERKLIGKIVEESEVVLLIAVGGC